MQERLPEPQEKIRVPETLGEKASVQGAADVNPFLLTKVEVPATSALPRREIDRVIAPFISRSIDAGGLARMAAAITTLYRDRGYFLSRAVIRPQEIHDGVLQLDLVEGYVGDVDALGLEADDARSQFAGTLSERPARRSTFERELLLLSDRYGFAIDESRLLTDPGDPARFRLQLKVHLKPVALRLYTDNRGTAANGPEQAFAAMAFNSVIAGSDQLTASLFVTPSDSRELFFASGNYARPWLAGNLWTEVEASISRTQDSTDLFGPVSSSSSERFLGKLSTPLVRSREESLWLAMSMERRHNTQYAPADPQRDETLVVLRGSLALTEASAGKRTDISLEVATGIDALGASRNDDDRLSQDDSRPQFARLRANASSILPLWSSVDLQLSATAQVADGALPASEELSIGGSRIGRAFDYATISGDEGWGAGAELRYTTAIGLAWVQTLQVYSFLDAAQVWNMGDDPVGANEADLASAGAGLRIVMGNGLVASLEAARALGDAPPQQGSTRFFFSLSWAM